MPRALWWRRYRYLTCRQLLPSMSQFRSSLLCGLWAQPRWHSETKARPSHKSLHRLLSESGRRWATGASDYLQKPVPTALLRQRWTVSCAIRKPVILSHPGRTGEFIHRRVSSFRIAIIVEARKTIRYRRYNQIINPASEDTTVARGALSLQPGKGRSD